MRDKIKKNMAALVAAAALGTAILGCGNTDGKEPAAQAAVQGQTAPVGEDSASRDGEVLEAGTTEETASGQEQKAQGSAEEEHIIGEIQEIGDGFLILNRYHEENLEDGGMLLMSPEEGSDVDKELVTVFFEDGTLYSHLTIRDGGDSLEETEANPDELAAGIEVTVNGKQEEDGFHASKIQVMEVVL